MSLEEALVVLASEVKNRIVLGYWKKNGQYIFNTTSVVVPRDVPQASQFVVEEDGTVYGTNPMISDLDEDDYIPLKKKRR